MTSSALSRLFRRLCSAEAAKPEQEPGPTPTARDTVSVANSEDRHRVTLRGTLRSVTHSAAQDAHLWCEAQLDDGSGELTLVWMGRRAIAGVEVDRDVQVRGRIARVGGRKAVYNPHYELLN